MRLIPRSAAACALLVLLTAPARTSSVSASVSPTVPVVATVATPNLSSVLGTSGNLRALIGLPALLEKDAKIEPLLAGRSIDAPGIHPLGVTAPDGDSLVEVSMMPFETGAKTGMTYHTGQWPVTALTTRNPRYTPPPGYIRVTPENASTSVSKRFRLADFLTHDQQNVWPKVLVLKTSLVDKLELIGESLDRRGLPSKLHIMSGFRTPQYNALEVHPGGRARNSRHMYGDASDIFVDADGDGRMDDLNHDGKIDVQDARVLLAVAEGVESAHPELIGGLSAYPATSAHGPFVHVDTRGFKARW